MKETYTIRFVHIYRDYCFMRDEQTVTGTIDYLLCFFRFALFLAHEKDERIPLYPATAEALTDALNEGAKVLGKDSHYYNESNV